MIIMNLRKFKVIKNGKEYNLSLNDFRILKALSGNTKVTHRELSLILYGKYEDSIKYEFNPYYHAVCTAVNRLKKKMNLDLVNHRHLGYELLEDIAIE